MRYWYDSDNLSWTSNDGYKIWLDSDITGYKLFSPDSFCLGVWFCDDLREQIGDLDIKLYEYMFYKAERFLTVIGIKIEDALNKAVCTRDYSSGNYYDLDKMPDPECTVKFKYEDLPINSCGQCHHLIFRDYRHNEGLCNLTRLHRCFYDRCVHEEEMS